MDPKEKTRENFYRRMAARLGLEFRKSKHLKWSVDNHLKYQIADAASGAILLGEKFDATLDEVVLFLEDYEKKLKD
jgi:hypothetical protein